MKGNPATICEYLAGLDEEKRNALQKLRKLIKSTAPDAEGCISYQMPAFRINGKVFFWFGAGANHSAFYPGGIVERYKDELEGYKTSRGTVQFQPAKPIPASLVRKIVKAQIAESKRKC